MPIQTAEISGKHRILWFQHGKNCPSFLLLGYPMDMLKDDGSTGAARLPHLLADGGCYRQLPWYGRFESYGTMGKICPARCGIIGGEWRQQVVIAVTLPSPFCSSAYAQRSVVPANPVCNYDGASRPTCHNGKADAIVIQSV